jgi:hypothetical protein
MPTEPGTWCQVADLSTNPTTTGLRSPSNQVLTGQTRRLVALVARITEHRVRSGGGP